jgi:hypothetical protein
MPAPCRGILDSDNMLPLTAKRICPISRSLEWRLVTRRRRARARFLRASCPPRPPPAGLFRPRLGIAANQALRNTKEDWCRADNAFMHRQDIQRIVDAAHETADAIVGARAWKTAEDASDMRDVIFWDLLAKQLPEMTVAQIVSELDRSLD